MNTNADENPFKCMFPFHQIQVDLPSQVVQIWTTWDDLDKMGPEGAPSCPKIWTTWEIWTTWDVWTKWDPTNLFSI